MWSDIYTSFGEYVPALATIAVVALVLWATNRILLKRHTKMGAEERLPRQLLMLLLTVVGVLVVILLFPMSDTTRGQVLGLLGIILTGVIAFSSTTFVANIMAGLMLRVVKSFRPGDFIHIGDKFGRVTERGLFHIEIQTEDRDLTTFPNLYLVTNPVTVVHSTGTIVSATLSLGYDVPRLLVEELLKSAAEGAGLHDPFVLVTDLGSFSVSYRVAGFLPEVKQLLTVKSNLRKQAMDVLHNNGVEIVSPTFMNQRPLPEQKKVFPVARQEKPESAGPKTEPVPEKIMFDKAELAEEIENMRSEHEHLDKQLKALREQRKSAIDDERSKLDKEITATELRIQQLAKQLQAQEEGNND